MSIQATAQAEGFGATGSNLLKREDTMMNIMKICRYGIGVVLSLGVLLSGGCEGGDGGASSVLPSAATGSAGQTLRIEGIGNGATVLCSRSGSDVWSFSVGFAAKSLDARSVVQLLVEIDKDSTGETVWESGRGPYVQGGAVSVSSSSASGSVSGKIGPPASEAVRFNIALRLVDASGQVVAVSPSVKGLKPVLQ